MRRSFFHNRFQWIGNRSVFAAALFITLAVNAGQAGGEAGAVRDRIGPIAAAPGPGTVPKPEAGRQPAPEEILAKADDIRSPAEDFKMKVKVANSDGGHSIFEVFIKGRDKTVVKTLSPARDKGRNMLMLGENMWAYVPNLKRTVRISLNQKLSGEAANGDISRMRWSGDYTPKLKSHDTDAWELDLIATRKGLTYERLEVRVQKGTFRPLTARFMTKSGTVLKICEFKDYKALAGVERPSQMQIQDAKRSNLSSLLTIEEMSQVSLNDSMFSQNNLN